MKTLGTKVLYALVCILGGVLAGQLAACYDGPELRSTADAPKPQPPVIGSPLADAGVPAAMAADSGVSPAVAGEVERVSSALWVNPPAGACTGSQPGNTLRITRYSNGTGPCMQFGANVEINYLGNYTWSDGTNANDNTNFLVGDVHGLLGKCQRLTVWWDWMFWGPSVVTQRCYTGQPNQGWNVWLINPDQFTFGASSLRYETW